MWTDRFGFLSNGESFEFDSGSIVRLPEFDEHAAWVAKVKHEDGFVYPRQVITVRQLKYPATIGDSSAWEEVPGTERPGLLHSLPSSHEIRLHAASTSADLRSADGAFIIHLLGYLFGLRVQFTGWRLDMRIPVESTHGAYVHRDDASAFVSQAYRTWQGWPERSRKKMTNALYMNARSPCYEWGWEQFMMNYMVFDALYRIAVDSLGLQEASSHRDRFERLANRFTLARDVERWERIYALRNELFHEALWEGFHPCTDGSLAAEYASHELRRINHRLIPALLEFDTGYVRSAWWIFDNFAFVER